ncbi:uncharacterized protein FOMMEDRAFT_16597 [Fomitiporia mediterranea MF3/22]|uniref:uncharacterized protein n=1 Tax=Fomitiporia mediterranea (strain MF3/22) TaxID=694068 RepID=UPI00044072D5|nr:uncharacterized protein FOMMEDRAFT_16597 [Fomitiporia mediterranea MF3/22]EJD08111.1 hypothetical protein FOMMEDRAFT_16597 [Fomitiporia mediterranea MF3/22]
MNPCTPFVCTTPRTNTLYSSECAYDCAILLFSTIIKNHYKRPPQAEQYSSTEVWLVVQPL